MDALLKTTTTAIAVLLFATAAQAAGDPSKGQALFARCQVCHTADKGWPNRVGPNLFGVVGRKAGALPSYSYSTAMKKFGAVWDQPTLSKYLMGPSQVVPGTKMTFAGFSNQQQADDVAAYLATLK
jgi:cytochrome c